MTSDAKRQSDTPRTDAVIDSATSGEDNWRDLASALDRHARQLERELAEAKEHAEYEANRAEGAIKEMIGMQSATARNADDVNVLNEVLRRAGWSQGEIDATAADVQDDLKDTARMDYMERHLCRAGEVKNSAGQTVKLARVWSIMGELETLRETVDALMAAQDRSPSDSGKQS